MKTATTESRRPGGSRKAAKGEPLLRQYLSHDYSRQPGDTRDTWCITLEAILHYARISVDEFRQRVIIDGVPLKRTTAYAWLAGQVANMSEEKFIAIAAALGVPRMVVQTMDPEDAVEWIRQYVESDFREPVAVGAGSVQNRLVIAA